nr:reverse transcriptase domain-containing protein [Tanacetum cinerariifolium]
MQTRSSSRLTHDQSSKQKVENSNLEEHLPPVVTMDDNRTMPELLRAPTEGYAEAIMVPSILAEQFELKHSLINMMTTDQFFRLKKDNPHDHIRVARRWLEKEPPHYITTWEDLLSKFINEFFPPSRTTSLRNEISNFQQKIDESFHEAWDRYKDLPRACRHHVGESSPNLTTSNPKRRNRRCSKQPFILEESPVDTMADQRTMAELLRAPTEGYAEEIVVSPILAEHFELKHSLINMMTSDQFFRLVKGNPHDHIRCLVLDGPSISMPPPFINLEEDERAEETLTNLELAEDTIKVPPSLVQKAKPPS